MHERLAASGDFRVAQFLDVVERGEFTLKLVLKLAPHAGRSILLRKKNSRNSHRRDDEAHRDEQLPAEA